mmetsp:Transcript_77704/g.141321  ORF Transcript_77704/g.141321 Transcript_77704/m.141321 type:complete len:128 (-) Transcript_77704:508-891(-)
MCKSGCMLLGGGVKTSALGSSSQPMEARARHRLPSVVGEIEQWSNLLPDLPRMCMEPVNGECRESIAIMNRASVRGRIRDGQSGGVLGNGLVSWLLCRLGVSCAPATSKEAAAGAIAGCQRTASDPG